MNEPGNAPVEMVLAFYAAVVDGRIDDVLALVDPQVVCRPLTRPGLATYFGHDGMAELVRAVRTAYGNYQVQAEVTAVEAGPVVTVQARVCPEPGRGLSPYSATTTFQFRDGLIASIDADPGPASS